MNSVIKEILIEALNIKRWAHKTNIMYPFLDEEEIKEMVENIIKELYAKGYEITKKK
jgi:N-acetyl-anhydromuramyl-L-alanine amidase AmpD